MNTIDTNKHEGTHPDIASSVLSRITNEGLTPTPRYHFLLRDGVVWALGGFSVIVGAFGVAAIIFTARHSEWQSYQATHDSLGAFLFDIMPYTWIVTLGLFAALSFAFVRHTKRGYRYQVIVLMVSSVGASAALGTAVFAFGAGPFIDQKLGAFIPLHRSLHDKKLGFWNQPDRGLVEGVVTDIATATQSFTVMSPTREIHTIGMDNLSPDARAQLAIGKTVRVFAPLVERTVDEDASGHVLASTTPRMASTSVFAAPRTMMRLAPRTKQQGDEREGSAERSAESEIHHVRKMFREACATILVRDESDDGDDDMMQRTVEHCHTGAGSVK